MKKVLFVATVTLHINSFHIPFLKMFKEKGYEVHVASFGEEKIEYCDKHFNIPFARFPLKPQNYRAYKELKEVIKNNDYEIIHCHTPVGGVLTRLAARKERKKGTRVIYTAHGFHFYKGAPILNWLIYYPLEKWLSKYTDCLITINQEDYEIAKRKFKAKQIELVHGVGMNTKRFDIEITENEKQKLRDELGIKEENIVLSYVAELNDNKNQILLINSIEELVKTNDKYKLLIVGDGLNKEKYQEKINNKNLQDNVKLLGSRKDVPQILSITNIYVASSIREGLPVNIMEAMYMRLPIVATNNRGHRELVQDKENGFVVNDVNNFIEFAKTIEKVNNNAKLKAKFENKSRGLVRNFVIENVIEETTKIYLK